jgi:hypothetical protein
MSCKHLFAYPTSGVVPHMAVFASIDPVLTTLSTTLSDFRDYTFGGCGEHSVCSDLAELGEREPVVAKGLAVLVGMLAVLFAAPTFAHGVSPSAGLVDFEEGKEPPEIGSEVEVTGYLSPVYPRNVYSHLLNDETTGATYFARGEEIDLDSYDDGQRITISGTLLAVEDYQEPILEVTGVKPADDTTSGETATLEFELTVEGEPPADATFFGTVRGEGLGYVPLMDHDDDGVYTGSTTVARFAPGTRPLPSHTEPVSMPVQIVQGTETRGPDASDALRPGEPIRTIKDFGPVQVEDRTLAASVSFGGEQGGSTTPESDNDSSGGGGYAGGTRSLLPGTSGVVLTLGVGALLVAGGFLIRRITR